MRESLLIFRKDVRHLWPRIGLVWALLALFTWQDSGEVTWSWDLTHLLNGPLLLASWLLIVSVIQEEALPGDRQYWLTRPLSRSNLLFAKALFVMAFLQLPVLLSQIVSLAVSGISPAAFVPLLLRKQFFFTAWIVLPAVTMAAVTRNLAQFALSSLAFAVLATLQLGFRAVGDWGHLEPVRTWAMALAAIALAAEILRLQYMRHRTRASRMALFVGGLAIGLAPTFSVPPGAAAVLAWFSPHPAAEAKIRAAFSGDDLPKQIPENINVASEDINLRVPLQLTGIPDGWSVEGDAVQWDMEAADGQRWHSSWALEHFPLPDDGRYSPTIPISAAFWKRERKSPVHVRARFAYTLVATAPSITIPSWTGRPGTKAESRQDFHSRENPGSCMAMQRDNMVAVICRSPLHRPDSADLRIVSADALDVRANWSGSDAFFSVWQYAETARVTNGNPPQFQLEISEPVSHFVREIDVREFPLDRCLIDLSSNAGGSAVGWWHLF